MYHDDHPPPHIHAEYQGNVAMICIITGEVLKGKLPQNAIRLIKEWVLAHEAELKNNWHLAKNLEPLEKIPGADND